MITSLSGIFSSWVVWQPNSSSDVGPFVCQRDVDTISWKKLSSRMWSNTKRRVCVFVCMCVCCRWETVLVWRSQYRLDRRQLSEALVPHYLSPTLQAPVGTCSSSDTHKYLAFLFLLGAATQRQQFVPDRPVVSRLRHISNWARESLLGKSCTTI